MKNRPTDLKTLATLLSTGLFFFCLSSKANAFGGYQPHEHPFAYVSEQMSQGRGDAYCRQLYTQMKNQTFSARFGTDDVGIQWGGSVVTAFDRVDIGHPWHIWYHANNSECVANQ